VKFEKPEINEVQIDIERYAKDLGLILSIGNSGQFYVYLPITNRIKRLFSYHPHEAFMYIYNEEGVARIYQQPEKALKLLAYIELKLGKEYTVKFID
jgi:hypothetical protein